MVERHDRSARIAEQNVHAFVQKRATDDLGAGQTPHKYTEFRELASS
jgi:hypothetical protein